MPIVATVVGLVAGLVISLAIYRRYIKPDDGSLIFGTCFTLFYLALLLWASLRASSVVTIALLVAPCAVGWFFLSPAIDLRLRRRSSPFLKYFPPKEEDLRMISRLIALAAESERMRKARKAKEFRRRAAVLSKHVV